MIEQEGGQQNHILEVVDQCSNQYTTGIDNFKFPFWDMLHDETLSTGGTLISSLSSSEWLYNRARGWTTKSYSRGSSSRWVFNNACQVGRSWKGQPNLIHIPFLRETKRIYGILQQLSSAISQTKKRKEKNGTYQPFYKKSPSTFILLTQKQKKVCITYVF